jgi:OFA family oxalate/formate antiporter-like MFS transporter
MNNKWIRGAIPALLIHCSIGTVYCWSLLRNAICNTLEITHSSIEWAFSLAIFFLGMSAAFCGNLVEKNVKLSAIISTICFTLGMVGTGIAIHYQSTIGVLLSYGCLMGIGLGIGYLTPVKTLMMWFHKNKGLATGIAITGFGLAKVIASPIIEYLQNVTSIQNTFYILGGLYCVLMSIGTILIKKPHGMQILKGNPFNFKESVKFICSKEYLAIWTVFFLNITCGLALISQEKPLLQSFNFLGSVAIIASLTAIFNSLGRFMYASLSDKLIDRGVIYSIIFVTSVLACFIGPVGILGLVIALCICNAGYGGGFSTLPSLLSDKFGMNNVSTIHGFALSAWAWAGLCGNHLGNYLLVNYSPTILFIVLSVLYLIAASITYLFINKWKN